MIYFYTSGLCLLILALASCLIAEQIKKNRIKINARRQKIIDHKGRYYLTKLAKITAFSSRWKKRRLYYLYGSIPLAVFGILLIYISAFPSHTTLIKSGITTLTATLTGAIITYIFTVVRARAEITEKHYNAYLWAQTVLSMQWNDLENTRRAYLEEYRNHPTRFVLVSLYYSDNYVPTITLNDLAFISLSHEPNFLLDIHTAQQAFLLAKRSVEILRERKDTFYNSPNIERSDFDSRTGEYNARAINDEGKSTLFLLKQATDSAYEHIDHAIKLLFDTVAKSNKFLVIHFHKKVGVGILVRPENQ